MKLGGEPVTYQIMFELNAGGTFVARVETEELVPFMHEEMRVEMDSAERAVARCPAAGRNAVAAARARARAPAASSCGSPVGFESAARGNSGRHQ